MDKSIVENLNQEQIDFLDKCADSWVLNEETGLVDCNSFSSYFFAGLKDLKGISFGVCKGNFSCYSNRLTSLDRFPNKVGGNFNCSSNCLTSLEGCPKEVGGNFSCNDNLLTSLEGCPKEVGGSFSCYGNRLTSLVGGPKEVGGAFTCYKNLLTSLVGGPKEVGGSFDCDDNELINLDVFPDKIGGYFSCKNNPLKTFENLFNINPKGNIDSDLFILSFLDIRSEMDKGLTYKDSLLKVWPKIHDKDKKFLVNDLPVDGLGKIIKRANKFGMNI